MRNAFADEITQLAAADPRIVLVSGDIGNRLFDKFKAQFPDRFYNVGVAEADMISIAAGLAMGGLRPVTYTIASFAVYRALEQIRVDVGYHNQPVVMIGAGSGLSYAANGATHHCCEDLAVLRAIPNLTVACPADAWEVRGLLREALKSETPVYLRIGKKGEPTVHRSVPDVRLGQGLIIRSGSDVAVLCTGTLLPEAVAAAETLSSTSLRREPGPLSIEVISFHTVKPLDEELLRRVFGSYRLVVTVEEHSRIGGLGSAVAEWKADHGQAAAAKLLRLGTADEFLHHATEQEHARNHFRLTREGIADAIQTEYESIT